MLTSKELYDKVEKIRIQKGMPVAQLNFLQLFYTTWK